MTEAADPQAIGKYKILGFLGQGAMGKVYKAEDPILNRYVAIKTISATLASDPELRKRFHREAQAAARLNHPNIITVYEYGEESETIFIAMELLEGTDLKGFMDSGALQSLGAKLRIMEQICDGLTFAHSKGVVHRDLKPANVHVSNTGQVKIMDFGLARLDSGDRSKAGMVVGTPNYMSPEQVMGDEVDARTDVFSAGAVFYELLTNKKPFDADSVHGILFQVVHKEPAPLRTVIRELPPIVAEVVDRALAKDRGQRFQSSAEFREALGYIQHALESGRPNEARLSRPGDPTMLGSRSLVPLPAGPPSSPSIDVVDGTVALDMQVPVRRPAPRPSDGSTSAARNRSTPPAIRTNPRPPAPAGGSAGKLVAAALLTVALGAGGYYAYEQMLRPAPTAAAPGDVDNAQVSSLTSALVKAKLELARERLDDKNYAEAIALGDEVLGLAPQNADARAIREHARRLAAELDAAAVEARAAVQAGDNARASTALSQLLSLDPKHPAAVEVSAHLNSSFRKQAEEARQLAAEARQRAEKAGGASNSAFQSGTALARDADGVFGKGSFADATRGFLESRDLFERARRAAAAPPTAAPAVATATPVETRAAAHTPAPVAPTFTPEPELVPPVEARRAFALGNTVIQSKRAGKAIAGFESSDVSVQQATELNGRIDLTVAPAEVRAGDTYSITATFTNIGRRPVRIKEATLTYRVNGQPRVQPVAPETRDVGPNQSVKLAETGGVWEEGIQNWQLEVAVVSDKGETCRREVRLARP